MWFQNKRSKERRLRQFCSKFAKNREQSPAASVPSGGHDQNHFYQDRMVHSPDIDIIPYEESSAMNMTDQYE